MTKSIALQPAPKPKQWYTHLLPFKFICKIGFVSLWKGHRDLYDPEPLLFISCMPLDRNIAGRSCFFISSICFIIIFHSFVTFCPPGLPILRADTTR